MRSGTMLPSGRPGIFINRVAWAKSHLEAAGLIESSRRGFYKIASHGLDVRNTRPNRMDLPLLKQFPEYIEFRKAKRDVGSPQPSSALDAGGEGCFTLRREQLALIVVDHIR